MTLMFQKEKLRHGEVAMRYSQGHGTCKGPHRAGTLICRPLDSFPLHTFPQGWGTLQQSILETAWNQSCGVLSYLALTLIWWNGVGLHC